MPARAPGPTPGQAFADRLEAAMRLKKLRRADVSRQAGIARWTITQWLAGEANNPDLENVRKVAGVLGVSVHQLIDPLIGYERDQPAQPITTAAELDSWIDQHLGQLVQELRRHVRSVIVEELAHARSGKSRASRPKQEPVDIHTLTPV